MQNLTLRTDILTFSHTTYQCPAQIACIGIDINGCNIAITETGEKYLLAPDQHGRYLMSGDSSSWATIDPILLPEFLEAGVEPDGLVEIEAIKDKRNYYLAIFDTASESDLSKIIQVKGLLYQKVTLEVLISVVVRGILETFDSFSYPNPERYDQYNFFDIVTYCDLLDYRINEINQKYGEKIKPSMGKVKVLPPRK